MRREFRAPIRTPDSVRQKYGAILINYGCSTAPSWDNPIAYRWINHPDAVNRAANKILTFKTLAPAVNLPEWTTSKETAQQWLANGHIVYARTKIRSSSARGLIVVEPGQVLPNAPLYTKRFRTGREYRIHVVDTACLVVQKRPMSREKLDLAGLERADSKVRNIHTGWVYSSEIDKPPAPTLNILRSAAVAATKKLGLDYGAADIMYSPKWDEYVVLEVNSAPVMSNTLTQSFYINELKQLIKG